MKLKALVIAPYQGLAELTSSLAGQLADFQITVVQGDLFELPPDRLRAYEEEGYDVIISRGGTAKLIREHCSLPVVDIKVSGYDILRLLTLLKEYKTKVHMIGFPNIIEAVIAVSKLLEVHIPHTIIREQDEVNGALEEARRSGALVIVGGSNTVRLAKEHGLQGILVTSGRESVLEAFEHAKNICLSMKRHQDKHQMLEALISGVDSGAAVIGPNGELKYANPSFAALLKLDADERQAENAFIGKFPKAAGLLKKAWKSRESGGPIAFYDSTFKHQIAIVPQPAAREGEEPLFSVYVRPVEDSESDLSIRSLEGFLQTFPPLIQAMPGFQEALAAAEGPAGRRGPLTVYGEPGTGKRILAGVLADRLGFAGDQLFEAAVLRGSDEAFERLVYFVDNAPRQTVCYMRGLERFALKTQRKLAQTLSKAQALLIASFEKPPRELLEEGLLHAELHDTLCTIAIAMKPLRDHLTELGELVRIYIAENNGKYGKQVVGIRPAVLQSLYERPWKGNLIELRDTVEELVKLCRGEYIDEETLALLETKQEEQSMAGSGKTINLNQTFQEIQKDIVQIVLREENMNQSRAAKRLGLNRSTLWRILKEQS